MATSIIQIQIPPEKVQLLRDMLKPGQVKRAAYQAVNRTARKGERIVQDVVLEQVAIDPARLRGRSGKRGLIYRKLSRDDVPVADIVVSGKPVPLVHYKERVTKRRGVKVVVARNQPPIELSHAFTANVASAKQLEQGAFHYGIFGRAPRKAMAAARLLGKLGSKLYRAGARHSGFVGRLPIEERFGPRMTKIIDVPVTQAKVKKLLGDELLVQLDGQLRRFMDPKIAAGQRGIR